MSADPQVRISSPSGESSNGSPTPSTDSPRQIQRRRAATLAVSSSSQISVSSASSSSSSSNGSNSFSTGASSSSSSTPTSSELLSISSQAGFHTPPSTSSQLNHRNTGDEMLMVPSVGDGDPVFSPVSSAGNSPPSSPSANNSEDEEDQDDDAHVVHSYSGALSRTFSAKPDSLHDALVSGRAATNARMDEEVVFVPAEEDDDDSEDDSENDGGDSEDEDDSPSKKKKAPSKDVKKKNDKNSGKDKDKLDVEGGLEKRPSMRGMPSVLSSPMVSGPNYVDMRSADAPVVKATPVGMHRRMRSVDMREKAKAKLTSFIAACNLAQSLKQQQFAMSPFQSTAHNNNVERSSSTLSVSSQLPRSSSMPSSLNEHVLERSHQAQLSMQIIPTSGTRSNASSPPPPPLPPAHSGVTGGSASGAAAAAAATPSLTVSSPAPPHGKSASVSAGESRPAGLPASDLVVSVPDSVADRKAVGEHHVHFSPSATLRSTKPGGKELPASPHPNIVLQTTQTPPQNTDAAAPDEFFKLFRDSPNKAIKWLISNEICREDAPEDVARILLEVQGLPKSRIGRLLGDANPFNQAVLTCMLHSLEFAGEEIDDALRKFLSYFVLPGEAQQIDRVIEQFANRYYEQNSHAFKTKDAGYLLAFAIIMLNTDAHNPKIKRRMTREDFVRNLRGVNNSEDLDRAFLEGIYDRIVANEIRMKDVMELLDEDEYRNMFINGTDFIKHGRRGKPHPRHICISEDGKKVQWKIPQSTSGVREMSLSEVVGVHKGASTAVFKRQADIDRKNKLCLSLIGKKRTLDLEAPSENIRDLWCEHFALIVQRNHLENRARERKRLMHKRGKTYARAKALWEDDILAHWDQYNDTVYLRQLILQGVPTFVRGRVWLKLIGNACGLSEIDFTDCVAQARVLRSFVALLQPGEKITGFGDSMLRMKRDVESTFPDIVVNLQGESESSEGDPSEKPGAQTVSQEVLDVLDAWIIYRPEVGYVEGLAFVASIFLIYNKQFESFMAMANMLQMPCLDCFITRNQLLVEARVRFFDRALKDEMPSLHSQFQRLDIRPEMYLADWFTTVFARALPLEICTRIWDWFLLEGEMALFRTAYGILYVLSNRLENCTREEALTLLQGRFIDLEASMLFQAIERIKIQPRRWNDFQASLEASKPSSNRKSETLQAPSKQDGLQPLKTDTRSRAKSTRM
eukprot:ANDGO_07584.mRNA.1 Ankyrin repeat